MPPSDPVFFHNPRSRANMVHGLLEELGAHHLIQRWDGARIAQVLEVNAVRRYESARDAAPAHAA